MTQNSIIVEKILAELESLGSEKNREGMARYAIRPKKVFGVATPEIKRIGKEAKRETEDRHLLALDLWQTGYQEARAVAYTIDDPKRVTSEQMDSWARDFDNWAICDSTCGHLFSRTELAYQKSYEWADCDGQDEEFVKRAGLVLPAWLAIHDKKAPDEKIEAFLPLLESKSDDNRNFIKKAVNWSLRGIGKRSFYLNSRAIETAHRIALQDTKSARWIASGALKELESETVKKRLEKKESGLSMEGVEA